MEVDLILQIAVAQGVGGHHPYQFVVELGVGDQFLVQSAGVEVEVQVDDPLGKGVHVQEGNPVQRFCLKGQLLLLLLDVCDLQQGNRFEKLRIILALLVGDQILGLLHDRVDLLGTHLRLDLGHLLL